MQVKSVPTVTALWSKMYCFSGHVPDLQLNSLFVLGLPMSLSIYSRSSFPPPFFSLHILVACIIFKYS